MEIHLPEDLSPFQELALSFLREGAVKAIEFSGGTYQVQIDDPYLRESVWAFLQLDEKGRLRDRFCSCEGGEEVSLCPHLAAAFLALFGKHATPLHLRFETSLWRFLAQRAYFRWGDDSSCIKMKKEKIGIGKDFFCLGKTEKAKKELKEIFLERTVETEETSLKFSNLSKEEIRHWREGRPSPRLIFELSFWSDLAKWLLLKAEREPYTLSFEYDKKGMPHQIFIEFSDVLLKWVISFEELPLLIPTLVDTPSPLKVYTSEEWIQSIVYEEEKKVFRVNVKEMSSSLKEALQEKGISLQDWIYLPKEGFYSAVPHPLFEGSLLPEKVLTLYTDLLKKKMEGAFLNVEATPLFYSLSFDKSWNLLVSGYLFEPEDLSVSSSAFFGTWAYFGPQKRFYPLEGVVFDRSIFVVPQEEMADFIRRHRIWLDHQPGFQTYVTPIETAVSYAVTEENRLYFFRKAAVEEIQGKMKDFGAWVYIAGQGFFAKSSLSSYLPFEENVSMSADQIPLFIRANKLDLEGIVGFFSERCPIKEVGLKVSLEGVDTVLVMPEYRFYSAYQDKEVKIFDEYIYVPGEGFSVIPLKSRFSVRFLRPVRLSKDHFVSFFSQELGKIQEFILEIDPRLVEPERLEAVVSILEKEEGGGYLMTLSYVSEKGSVSSLEIIEAKRTKKRYLFSPAGRIDLSQNRFQWIRGNERFKGKKLLLSPLELLRLTTFDSLYIEQGQVLLEELLFFKSDQEPDFSLLKSQLRPYQEQGAKWLWFLYQHQFSGLLCDDMGLGKTHQTMALMGAIWKSLEKKKPFLIVCPTSVICHWEDKLREFLPELKVSTFHGVKRDLEDFERGAAVLLTSYGIWKKEAKKLSKISFEAAIFDEIHAAKNQKSRIHVSLLEASAKVKIGLTGTPIENRLRELKALFDLILPGLMPSESQFRSEFVIPIEKENNSEKKAFLSRLMHPFMLRRKKEEVLSDLPEKIEELAHCELSPEQKELYDGLLHRMRAGLIEQLQDLSSPIPFLHIFSVLSGLKQICNHPAAYLKTPAAYAEYRSGKWDLFVELVNEALESGQKVVVFSQYLAMLDMMELYFQESKIDFAVVRGSTVHRGEEVRRFNQEEDCQIFLGSLHAAGLGIDLTAASVVIHYDRWWNAAREDQATDRVHRIGQKRGVQVFKLVTKGTFEERIDEIIVKKGKLMEEIVGVDDYRLMKRFTREELIQFLSDL